MASTPRESQEHGQAYGLSKVNVTILASEWGSSKGGLSTINRELAIQLAKFADVEITFFVPQCSDEDKSVALSHSITIVEATRRPGYEELEWLSFPPEHLKIDVIVGHGVKLGRQAQVIRESRKCKWVQVVHTDPEELGMFKSYPNPISKGEEKHHVEVELCEMSDFVVGVGPKLSEAFRAYLRWCQKDKNVFDFTPGIFDEFVSVKQVTEERQHRSILVFGRGEAEDFKLKGFDIAARAVATLPGTSLVFVGAPDGEQEEIAQRLLDCGIPAKYLKVRSYVKSRESLKRLFCEVDLVLMPSRTEGFGLTGLEALSAGLPVLVSKNSGFGEALSEVPFGSSFVIDSEDPKVWAEAINNIWSKTRKTRLGEAAVLRDSYEKEYSWAKQSNNLLDNIASIFTDVSSDCQSSAQKDRRRWRRSEDTKTKEHHAELIDEKDVVQAKDTSVETQSEHPETMCCLKGETLELGSRVKTVTVRWKHQSLVGFGGDESQTYVLCDYTTSRGNSVPVYIQEDYDIPQKLTIDSRLQYGTQDNALFFVYHDKSQTPYQERFRSDAANRVLKIWGIDISWMAGKKLVNV